LEPFAEVMYFPGKEITMEKVKDADVLIIRTRTKCNADLLEGSLVKFIATATIGFDHIDIQYCKLKGIEWANAPGCNSGSVMQYIASALVFLSDKYNFSLSKKTIGIVGVGNVGAKVASMASILGMKVLLNDPPRERKEGKAEFVSIEKILQEADIISFHVPLNRDGKDKTYHYLNEEFLSKMKQGTIIINSSRGEVVSGAILEKGLKSKGVKAAILDVWENEPDIDHKLLKLVDIGTPHIAGYSADGKAIGASMSVRVLSKYFNLGIDNWSPSIIPLDGDEKIVIDCEGLSSEEIIKKAITVSYNITGDDKRLRNSPETFEQQRAKYPIRREFQAYRMELKNDSKNVRRILSLLGFNCEDETIVNYA